MAGVKRWLFILEKLRPGPVQLRRGTRHQQMIIWLCVRTRNLISRARGAGVCSRSARQGGVRAGGARCPADRTGSRRGEGAPDGEFAPFGEHRREGAWKSICRNCRSTRIAKNCAWVELCNERRHACRGRNRRPTTKASRGSRTAGFVVTRTDLLEACRAEDALPRQRVTHHLDRATCSVDPSARPHWQCPRLLFRRWEEA